MPAFKVYKRPSSRAFFLELVLDLVVFVFCAVICLQVFAQAHVESSRSAALSQLGIKAERCAELFKAGYSDAASLAVKLNGEHDGESGESGESGERGESGTISWYYDRDLQTVGSSEAFYTLTCAIDGSRAVKVARITVTEGPEGSEEQLQLLEYVVSSYHPDNNSKGTPSGGGGS